MKKLISALLAGAMLTVSSVGVYADGETSLRIGKAEYLSTGKVKVTGTITNASASQSITVMSTGIKDGAYDPDQILYIDQQDDVTLGADGSFTIEFALSDKAVKDTDYFVRIGGTNISSPDQATVRFTEGGGTDPKPEIKYGDVTGDGTVNADDAKALLDYVLDPANNPLGNPDNAQIRGEGKTDYTAADAAMILQKVLDSNFSFPVEANK